MLKREGTFRQLLRLSAAAAGAPALAPVLDRRAYAKKPGPSSIAIVGGGVAGLTAASFAAARREAGSVRSQQPLGGRMFTQYDFYKGMFCELGGECTGHEDLQNLATEVGVEMQT